MLDFWFRALRPKPETLNLSPMFCAQGQVEAILVAWRSNFGKQEGGVDRSAAVKAALLYRSFSHTPQVARWSGKRVAWLNVKGRVGG